jgi:glutamine amidotransferase
MGKVVILNTGLCNLDSIARAVEECGGTPAITQRPEPIRDASHIILPGVGAFPKAMANLLATDIPGTLQQHVLRGGVPFLGICLGMQLLATYGYEHKETAGLGWIDGEVRLIEPRSGERIPHIGWNEIELARESPLFAGIESGKDFFFVHSFALRPDRLPDIVATTPYGGGFVSAVQRDNVYGVQFHPEKSQRVGFQVLGNFLQL